MFIKLKDGRKLNLLYLSDAFLGKHDKKLVIFYLVNSTKLLEGYATEKEAEERVEEVKEAMEAARGGGLIQKDTFSDFPPVGNKGFVYIAKDTGQTYYWDPISKTYITTGTAGRTGVYQWDKDIPNKIGQEITIPKSELDEILKASVDYMDGSTVIGMKGNTGIIVGSDANNVTIKVTAVQTTDSFVQVDTESDLPSTGIINVLYYLVDEDEFRIWDVANNCWQIPSHPIIYNSTTSVADAKVKVLYINGKTAKYTLDNKTWIYLTNPDEEIILPLTFDGTNKKFDLPTVLKDKEFGVYINGLRNFEGDDYTVDRTVTPNTITFDLVYDTFDVCKIKYINEILT
ncbi:hypothetical protein [uncultured Clostridium sp.]|uniref:hypothetical protein n=1 Tax=uncultured Clostridium sp. TaxID=59620 RepID=UPI0026E9A8B2|nr:hypothetical protein [uncultured Clostridium sp.]